MSGAREIRNKIASVTSTAKITRAMEMVATSKIRKATERMNTARPYAQAIRTVISHLAEAHLESTPDLMKVRPPKRIGYVVITSDKGLCGGLNINLFKLMLEHLRSAKADHDASPEVAAIGGKGRAFFNRSTIPVSGAVAGLGDFPEMSQAMAPVSTLLRKFADGKLDRLYLASNRYVNTMTQQPEVRVLLPLSVDIMRADEMAEEELDDAQGQAADQATPVRPAGPGAHWDYLYEPGSSEILGPLVERYVAAMIQRGVVENFACEQAAKMLAMKNATDNANDIVDDLQLLYNNARQSAITQELSEIIGGAAAV